jgi:AGCS family alanine or glycine:cation symporter
LVWGIKRGLFSNEAGQGSAPIAHAAAKTDEPVREGVVALLEPFIDTLMICTMTGLVIIITGVWDDKHDTVINLNGASTNIEMVDEAPYADLTFVDGVAENALIYVNDATVDTLYTNEDQSAVFNGVVTYTEAGFSIDGKTGKFYGNIVENGAPLTALAFERGLSVLFPGGQIIVTFCVLLFGISTSISWSYYGDRSIQYLLGDKSIKYYKAMYVIMHFVGAVLALSTVWAIGDIMLGIMTIPNIIALFALSGVVMKLTRDYFNKSHDNPDD